MDIHILNTTKYNKDLIIKYNQFFSRGYIKKNFIIMTLVAIGFIIYMLANQEYLYALLLVALIIIYFLLTLVLQKFTIKRMLAKSPLVEKPIKQTYEFFNDKVLVKNPQKTYEVPYDSIFSVKKGKDFFLIKAGQNKSLIVDFKGFSTEEDSRKLEEFFIIRFNMKD
ncbi:hypothetical protein HF295_01770 [Hujiaoplasma nucleasis]|uniref:YcxB-like C-terminal domain-containing protein n=1 Tax=Hujiaoplasma nucleasis TaxID=2725268 RepID=A0A7L6N081_9MOLU|nr:YcxB family protein [Hujiaoplasma nucleasis]QLY39656.1 hypothetical protein HF295_01770 [Hujiaoplasma nucleasis]